MRDHKNVLAVLAALFIGLTTIAGCTSTVPTASASAYPVVHEESFTVYTPDGLTLAAQAYGDPRNPEIVFIHGLGQSHLSWNRQVHSDLSEHFRIITYDLRGHGDSDKPADVNAYLDGRRWGDDLAFVMATAKLRRPVLVGWSLGGLVIGNYLATHGGDGIAGINLVDAVTARKAEFFGPASGEYARGLESHDLAERVTAIQGFLQTCFAHPLPPAEFQRMLIFNAMPPREVHEAVHRMAAQGLDEAFARVRVPTLITYGNRDALVRVGMAEYSAKLIPGARLSLYEGVGHSPFYESPQRFNRELSELIAGVATISSTP